MASSRRASRSVAAAPPPSERRGTEKASAGRFASLGAFDERSSNAPLVAFSAAAADRANPRSSSFSARRSSIARRARASSR
jgi:hypothetical protein